MLLFPRRIFLALALPLLCTAAGTPKHPRLFLTPARVAQLRIDITGVRKQHWDTVRLLADQIARQKPPVYELKIRNNDSEQLWQRDVGNSLPTLAIAFVLTGDVKYKKAVEALSVASCSYPVWGHPEKNPGTDLAAGHQLFGLALVYDWMYNDLDPQVRQTIHDTLLTRGRVVFQATDPKTGSAFWRESYLQNHMWVNLTGLTAAALAISEEPETAAWIEVARDKFRRTEDALGPDGASHEGAGYWTYGVEYLLKFWQISSDLFHEDLHSPWWAKTSLYRQYIALPSLSWERRNTIVDIADCTRTDYYGPDYQLFNLAHRFHDPHAQWLALELERAHVTSSVAPFLSLLWFDPEIKPAPPTDLPTLHYFDDIGIVSARSDWSGKESLVVFKCGPPAGHDEVKKQFAKDPGFGHVHPDANHFVIFGNGQWIIQDDGYRWKETGQHNTLLVDGFGQMGEHQKWFRRKTPLPLEGEPTILKVQSTPVYDFMAGDATGAYVPEAGLRRYVRRLIYLKPATVIVIDDIETDRTRKLELRFHPPEKSSVRIDDLTPDGVTADKSIIDGKDREGDPFPQYTVRMTTNAAKWRHAVAISWPHDGVEPAEVKLEKRSNTWRFRSGGHTATFNWNGTLQVQ
jgi:hypothetical protein